MTDGPLRGAAWREERDRRERELADATLQGWVAIAQGAETDATIAQLITKASACSDNPGTAEVGQLRRLGDAPLVHAALELAKARRKAKGKFAHPESLLADPEGVEMATSSLAARYKALRLKQARSRLPHAPSAWDVLDLCTGIGGDAMEFARAGLRVHAVDANPMRVALCAANLRRVANQVASQPSMPESSQATCTTAEALLQAHSEDPAPLTPPPLLHIDPSRRTPQARMQPSVRTSLHASAWEELSPPPTVLDALLSILPHAAIKQRAGLDFDALPPWLPACEAEVISESGKLTQCILWTGLARSDEAIAHETSPLRAALFRRATLLLPSRSDAAAPPAVHTLSGIKRTEPAPFVPIGAFVYEPDDALERTELLPQLCEQLGPDVGMPHPRAGLLSTDRELTSPWLRGFAVLANEPFATKSLAKLVARFDPGIVEVKTRAKLINPDEWQPKLSAKGPNPLAVFVLRFGEDTRTLVTRRLPRPNA